MELNLIYSILGIIGGILTAIGDILFDFKGKDNEELGTLKMINSNWSKMPSWRFNLSVILAFIGVPLCILGVISLVNQIENILLSNLLLISIIIGSITGFFIHCIVCIIPIIHKNILTESTFETSEKIIMAIWDVIKIPFIIGYVILILGTSSIVVYSILNDYLQVPLFCILLNPLIFQIIGITLRKINKNLFNEIPSIFMGSLGLSMYGVIGIINIL